MIALAEYIVLVLVIAVVLAAVWSKIEGRWPDA